MRRCSDQVLRDRAGTLTVHTRPLEDPASHCLRALCRIDPGTVKWAPNPVAPQDDAPAVHLVQRDRVQVGRTPILRAIVRRRPASDLPSNRPLLANRLISTPPHHPRIGS
eukprot:CAMPEP_0181230956 /NCGR_PEP_ID=MMETSP1096-20121128/34801_1 /TAXON_ID=156174 ORGANISM="Chrysochromulina ericina, Strain CCMP281" /NCGR_SAMPLE_ID=MMETSP1096 /ASSEMBLY_ACC=CAM_ASM_000453 /LENGTH=109 /DNA_ID=CAMNT_0023324869 /DNA_START=317 /DNA_END=642 /DNA_ORIENTATION=-